MLYELIHLFNGIAIIFLDWYYLKHQAIMDELSKRLILVGIMFSAHELSYLLHDPLIYQLTDVLFIVVLIYALTYIIEINKSVQEAAKKLEEAKKTNVQLMKRLEIIKEKTGK